MCHLKFRWPWLLHDRRRKGSGCPQLQLDHLSCLCPQVLGLIFSAVHSTLSFWAVACGRHHNRRVPFRTLWQRHLRELLLDHRVCRQHQHHLHNLLEVGPTRDCNRGWERRFNCWFDHGGIDEQQDDNRPPWSLHRLRCHHLRCVLCRIDQKHLDAANDISNRAGLAPVKIVHRQHNLDVEQSSVSFHWILLDKLQQSINQLPNVPQEPDF